MEVLSHLLRCDRHFSAGANTKSVVWVEENMGEEVGAEKRDSLSRQFATQGAENRSWTKTYSQNNDFGVVLL